jgi:hypothetical protein
VFWLCFVVGHPIVWSYDKKTPLVVAAETRDNAEQKEQGVLDLRDGCFLIV